ncbi:protein WVD2-like 4 [Phalaenopsis equestris]|uniref:protein WVD2-like 4 n=1 Tax=Phalaenopsis equestris TaxID=78828 RepID=UPI0009E2D9D6|nr:protein WVD2-like 4 [Phalaenopsis equestris]
MMEATDGVGLELSNGNLEKARIANMLGSGGKNGEKITTNDNDELEKNESDAKQADETLEFAFLARSSNGSELLIEDSSAVSENKVSVLSMKAATDQVNKLENKKTRKLNKDGACRNDAAVNDKNPKARLTQSLSFPTKSYPACGLKKITTAVKQTNVDVNGLSANNAEFASSDGFTASKLRFRATETRQKSLPINAVSVNEYTSSAATHHTSNTAVQRRSASGFSFRLDERAEKRKEFFLKLEEKIQAKELEMNNMQAKSMENQEAEIRQLRKSLTFKATPMPSFYQEPIPPKVELKKIPPTRARSPKLGRHKSASASANNSEVDDSIQSLETDPNSVVKQNGGAQTNAAAPKRTYQKPYSSLPSLKSTLAKPEAKLNGSKIKASNLKHRIGKPKVEQDETKQVDECPTESFAEVPAEVNCSLTGSELLTNNPGNVPIEA